MAISINKSAGNKKSTKVNKKNVSGKKFSPKRIIEYKHKLSSELEIGELKNISKRISEDTKSKSGSKNVSIKPKF